MIFQIVQEYERAVIFRLGRVLSGSRGPGKILQLSLDMEFMTAVCNQNHMDSENDLCC